MPAIEIRNLKKNFGKFQALKGISLKIEEGEIFGLLGPNGAGKTTLTNILATLLLPSGGSAKVMGHDVAKDFLEIRKIIGYTAGYASFIEHLTGWENMKFYAMAYGARPSMELVKIMGMEGKIHKQVSEYSSGMMQRLGFIVASIHDPKVLLLDEPTIGMDPNIAVSVRSYINSLRSKRTILLTTHNMYEAEDVCDRVGIISQGRIVALGTPAALKKKYRVKNLEGAFLKMTGMRLEV
ncbi:MAG TPA: ABC transporter ATP-binding protein [archaeon]|nr:ABC transporter ATP-binding protein [archaeon]